MRWEADVERHGFDAISLLFGGLLTGVGLLLIAGAGSQLVTGSWIAPAAAIILGIVLFIAAPRPQRRHTEAADGAERDDEDPPDRGSGVDTDG
jgi:hypothetical protein